MKMIEAIIRPEKLKAVKDSLFKIGINGLTINNVKGRGEQAGLEFTARSGVFRIDELPKVMLKVVIEDRDEDRVVEAICTASRTGEMGDGKIFIIPVSRAIKIRTGEEWHYQN